MENETTVVVEENAAETDIFGSLTEGFRKIIDLIMSIIEMIRGAVENITGE